MPGCKVVPPEVQQKVPDFQAAQDSNQREPDHELGFHVLCSSNTTNVTWGTLAVSVSVSSWRQLKLVFCLELLGLRLSNISHDHHAAQDQAAATAGMMVGWLMPAIEAV